MVIIIIMIIFLNGSFFCLFRFWGEKTPPQNMESTQLGIIKNWEYSRKIWNVVGITGAFCLYIAAPVSAYLIQLPKTFTTTTILLIALSLPWIKFALQPFA